MRRRIARAYVNAVITDAGWVKVNILRFVCYAMSRWDKKWWTQDLGR